MKSNQVNLTNLINQYQLKLTKIIDSCINIDQVTIAHASVNIAINTLDKFSKTKSSKDRINKLKAIMYVFISDKYMELSLTN